LPPFFLLDLVMGNEKHKVCPECGKDKLESEYAPSKFVKNNNSGKCKVCAAIDRRKQYLNNKEHILECNRQYKENNSDSVKAWNKKYIEENKEEIAEYKKKWADDNKEELAEYKKEYRETHQEEINNHRKERMDNDPLFRLRMYLSSAIAGMLKKRGSSKSKKSCWQFLPFTPAELVKHIEAQFSLPENFDNNGKPWMTWENHGKYNAKTWDENNSSTWAWQLDHKQPHSTFAYETMDCQEFRDCWDLSNLRPYPAKLNQLDGATRVRHKKTK
jgi:hypothetical protein